DHRVEEEDGGTDCSRRRERDACRAFVRQALEHRGHSAYCERQRQDNGCPHRYEARSLTILALPRGTCLHDDCPHGLFGCWAREASRPPRHELAPQSFTFW